MQIQLSEEEAGKLKTILEEYLSDLRMEIAGTDRMDYRTHLKETKVLLESLINRLKPKVL